MRKLAIISVLVLLPVLTRAQGSLLETGQFWNGKVPSLYPPEPDTVSLIVIGDVMMHKRQLDYDHSTFLQYIAPRLSGADVAAANMEFAHGGAPFTGYPSFSAPDSYSKYVADCGVDVLLTANNHIFDKGKKGVRRTLGIYEKMREEGLVHHTGTYLDDEDEDARNPLIIAAKGIRIALINVTYGTNASAGGSVRVGRLEKGQILRSIRRAREKKADFIVLLPHWGTEYSLKSNVAQRNLAQWMAENGADAIIGGHPHVVQDSSWICAGDRKVPVFYSVGNAVSNMSAPNTRLELAVTLRFVKERCGMRMIAPKVEYLWCTLPGKLFDSYATIAVKDFIGKREMWKDPADYDNMTATYNRVKAVTGVMD